MEAQRRMPIEILQPQPVTSEAPARGGWKIRAAFYSVWILVLGIAVAVAYDLGK
jgi:hypothetical protein